MVNATLDAHSDLLTTEEVTDLLLADRSRQRPVSTCVLPAIRQGGRWRFRKSDLDDWIRRQGQESGMVTS
jgi:excisionase family DNA binding protein